MGRQYATLHPPCGGSAKLALRSRRPGDAPPPSTTQPHFPCTREWRPPPLYTHAWPFALGHSGDAPCQCFTVILIYLCIHHCIIYISLHPLFSPVLNIPAESNYESLRDSTLFHDRGEQGGHREDLVDGALDPVLLRAQQRLPVALLGDLHVRLASAGRTLHAHMRTKLSPALVLTRVRMPSHSR